LLKYTIGPKNQFIHNHAQTTIIVWLQVVFLRILYDEYPLV